MNKLKEIIYVRFAEHISEAHRKGIAYEIEDMGGIVKQKEDNVYIITGQKNLQYIDDFILNEERTGVLVRLSNPK